MSLRLHELTLIHLKLRGHPADLARYAGLALQRSGHRSPTPAEISHNAQKSTDAIEWTNQDLAALNVIDTNRLTEDGAEGIALCYAHSIGGWIVKRRLERGESADWLLQNGSRYLALEVSGLIKGDCARRLKEKKAQVARCGLPVERLAVVVAFDRPAILAGTV